MGGVPYELLICIAVFLEFRLLSEVERRCESETLWRFLLTPLRYCAIIMPIINRDSEGKIVCGEVIGLCVSMAAKLK